MKLNCKTQYYRNIPLTLLKHRNYKPYKAKRFLINNTKQNVWIPNHYLDEDGTIIENSNLDFVFNNNQGKRKLELAEIEVNFGEIQIKEGIAE